MFTFAISLGVFSYILFFLGIFGFLTKQNIFFTSLLYCIWFTYFYNKLWGSIKDFCNQSLRFSVIRDNKLISFLLLLFVIQIIINIIGVLGPELGFDALWYHLTIPKLYLSQQSIFYIPGGLLYYSTMPKLTELFYLVGLTFGNEIIAKTIHFLFGLLSCLALFLFAKRYLSPTFSLFAVVVFYANLVVAWLSITAYIDLTRTFFEILALWGFLLWYKSNRKKWLLISAGMVGLAISTKVLAFTSLVVFLFLMIILKKRLQDILLYLVVAIVIPLPWFLFSLLTTGNPFYPFFSPVYPIGVEKELLSFSTFIGDIWMLFTKAADPISPLYIAFFPLLFVYYKKCKQEEQIIIVYAMLALLLWYITPRTGGGRFIVPYLPAFSFLVALLISFIDKESNRVSKLCILSVVVIALVSIGYRGIANSKYIPVIFQRESKTQFLSKNLNFSYGDFYDIDGYFKKNIKKHERVLLYGFHNLYYVNFPFVDSSWVQKGTQFTYIATQNTSLPKRFAGWKLVYENPVTKVKVYSEGGKKWVY